MLVMGRRARRRAQATSTTKRRRADGSCLDDGRSCPVWMFAKAYEYFSFPPHKKVDSRDVSMPYSCQVVASSSRPCITMNSSDSLVHIRCRGQTTSCNIPGHTQSGSYVGPRSVPRLVDCQYMQLRYTNAKRKSESPVLSLNITQLAAKRSTA